MEEVTPVVSLIKQRVKWFTLKSSRKSVKQLNLHGSSAGAPEDEAA